MRDKIIELLDTLDDRYTGDDLIGHQMHLYSDSSGEITRDYWGAEESDVILTFDKEELDMLLNDLDAVLLCARHMSKDDESLVLVARAFSGKEYSI